MRWPYLFSGLIACLTAAAAQADAALQERVDAARQELKAPGLSVAIRYPGGKLLAAASGMADVEKGRPMTPRTIMPAGSTGKTFVAALTLLLAEEGRLSLDDPISRWVGDEPWFDDLPHGKQIRVSHLLAHTSGLADYPSSVGYRMKSVWRAIRRGGIHFTSDELIGFAAGRRPRFAPGEGFHYSDAGYLVLGHVLEAAGGKSYYALMRERILVPHELTDVVPQDRSVIPGLAAGYTMGARNLRDDGSMKMDPSAEWTGGGLANTPTMLAQFFGRLAEGEIVKPQSFRAMIQPGWPEPAAWGHHYGLGVFLYEDGRAFGHAGLWMGYRSLVVHDLRTGITVAVQTNRDGRVDLEGLVRRLHAATRSESTDAAP